MVPVLAASGLLLLGVACSDAEPKASSTGTAVPVVERSFPSQGNDHLAAADSLHPAYNSTPPTSGWHLPALPRPGVYTTIRRPEELPHFMEHAGVWLLYDCPQGCEADVTSLRAITNRAIEQGRPVALAPYAGLGARFAAVAWQRLLTLDSIDRAAIDGFIDRFACAYNPESGPFCDGTRAEIGPTTGTPTPIAPQR